MVYLILTDLVVIIHVLFILFAVLGGLLLIARRYLIVVHLPAAIWASLISFMGWTCPLTPLENYLRSAAGADGYTGGFVEHYLMPVIYPVGITTHIHIILGILVVVLNICIYALVYHKHIVK
ncbi:MAG: DUF2784 domain-containing protein [Moritella sp.]|uniref:DUF2784 domain-containing protein n=1 Tax=Moritella sp. TaxID=78556 RepID=UPI001D2F2112|nr:DUF2784 domain-containing protein [Moritella sp.]NQZ50673.1 DUF2784 domain-containing protein [Moritella sp.]